MSWKFANLQGQPALRRRQDTEAKIGQWWSAFRSKTRELDDLFQRRSQWDLPAWMQHHLNAIEPNLCWEFGSDHRSGGHYLVITPEARKNLRPLVETILDQAPALEGWTFHGYRQPESLDIMHETIEARTGSTLPPAQVRPEVGNGNRINLVYQAAEFCSPADDEARHQAFVATESLLGEEVLDKWIGAVEVGPCAKGSHGLPLERLHETVQALVGSITEQLPDRPYFTLAEDAEWSLFKLQPEERDDYAGKEDLYVGVTMVPGVFSAWFGDPRFYSSCFSRLGERFCYVKIDGSHDTENMTFESREDMEDALNKELMPAGLGGVIGGGTGLRYSYIDLALTDVERAIPIIRQTLQAGRIPRRTWLLFCDCEWQDEFIPIWPEAASPPGFTAAHGD